jgi:hypothetical protein
MSRLGNKGNPYSAAMPDLLKIAQNTVWAAIAYSLALRDCEDDHAAIRTILLDEWRALHDNGIVPQPPPSQRAQP